MNAAIIRLGTTDDLESVLSCKHGLQLVREGAAFAHGRQIFHCEIEPAHQQSQGRGVDVEAVPQNVQQIFSESPGDVELLVDGVPAESEWQGLKVGVVAAAVNKAFNVRTHFGKFVMSTSHGGNHGASYKPERRTRAVLVKLGSIDDLRAALARTRQGHTVRLNSKEVSLSLEIDLARQNPRLLELIAQDNMLTTQPYIVMAVILVPGKLAMISASCTIPELRFTKLHINKKLLKVPQTTVQPSTRDRKRQSPAGGVDTLEVGHAVAAIGRYTSGEPSSFDVGLERLEVLSPGFKQSECKDKTDCPRGIDCDDLHPEAELSTWKVSVDMLSAQEEDELEIEAFQLEELRVRIDERAMPFTAIFTLLARHRRHCVGGLPVGIRAGPCDGYVSGRHVAPPC